MSRGAKQRRQAILDDLARNQVVHVASLSKQHGVSEVSIRRDLKRLEEIGEVRRIHGGAVALRNAPVATHSERALHRAAEKARIGRAGASLIQPGDRLIFDSGTTVLEVARHVPNDLRSTGRLTLITNSLPVLREMGASSGIHLILLGGVYLPQYEVVVGPITVKQLAAFHADKLFLGADGLTLERGVTTANVLEAEVNRATIEAASEVIVVADSTKIGQIGLTTIAPFDRIHKLITDGGAPADFVSAARERGVEVIMA